MILPGNVIFTILLLILSLLCWGSWASTFKLAGKWRFELFYFDFAIGVVFAALLAAFTFGSMGWDGFSFIDDLRNAGKRQDLFAFLGGSIFNLGNMLLLAAISVAGMSVAFPIAAGLAILVTVIWNYSVHPVGSPVVLSLGWLAILVTVILTALSYQLRLANRKKDSPTSPLAKGKKIKRTTPAKGLILATVSGLVLGSWMPFVDMSRDSELGLGPYSAVVVFSLGMVFTTFVFNLFFMNLPVQGEPVDFGEYFKGGARQHLLGLAGGILWSLGAVASFVASKAEGAASAGPAASYALVQGAPFLSTLLGLTWWKEFSETDGRTKTFVFVMLVFFAAGLLALSLAPQFASLR